MTLEWKEVCLSLPEYPKTAICRTRGCHTNPQQENNEVHPRGNQHILILCSHSWQHNAHSPQCHCRRTSKTSGKTLLKTKQLLDYAATNNEAIITYRARDIIHAIHSNVSYLSDPKARSRAGGHFFMSTDTTFSPNNGTIHNTVHAIKWVMSSTASTVHQ